MAPVRLILLTTALLLVACGPGETEEEQLVRIAREYLRAGRDGDADTWWELAATLKRNGIRETRLEYAGASPDDPFAFNVPEIPRDAAREMSESEFVEALFAQRKGPMERPALANPEIVIDEDTAEVRDPANRVRILLRREDGDWRVEADLYGEEYDWEPVVRMGEHGREILSIVKDLSRRHRYPMPLADLPGAERVDEKVGLRALIGVDAEGNYFFQEKPLDPDLLVERLMICAERDRNVEHPLRPSRVHALFVLHREARWKHALDAMHRAGHHTVRIRHVGFMTRQVSDYERYALHTRLRWLPKGWYPQRVSAVLTVGVGPVADRHLAAVRSAVAALELKGTETESGIRVALHPDLAAPAALSILVAVAASGDPDIHPVLAPDDATGWLLNGKPLAIDTKAEWGIEGPVRPDLVIRTR